MDDSEADRETPCCGVSPPTHRALRRRSDSLGYPGPSARSQWAEGLARPSSRALLRNTPPGSGSAVSPMPCQTICVNGRAARWPGSIPLSSSCPARDDQGRRQPDGQGQGRLRRPRLHPRWQREVLGPWIAESGRGHKTAAKGSGSKPKSQQCGFWQILTVAPPRCAEGLLKISSEQPHIDFVEVAR